MKKYKIKKLIFSSSASIYGLNKNKILEDSELGASFKLWTK